MPEKIVAIEAAPDGSARDNDGLHRRRGIWCFKVRVGGRWRELSTGTRNYKEARSKRRAMLDAAESGALPSDLAKCPLPKAVQAWLDSREHTMAKNTRRRDWDRSRALLRHFPAHSLAEITSDQIRAWQAKRAKVAAPRTINGELDVLRGMMKMAKRWAFVADDVRPLKEPHGPGRALSPEQETALFKSAASKPEWHVAYCAAVIAANTTARSCEIRGLRLSDVDLFKRTMAVRRDTTKTDAGARIVPLNDAALWALAQLTERAQALGANRPSHYLLPRATFHATKTGTPSAGLGHDPTQPMNTWRTAWRNLSKAAGLEGLRFHDLRHHAITKLAEAGVPDQTLMSMAGHVSRQMLEHYSHVRMEAKRAAVAAISFPLPGQRQEPEPAPAIQ